MRGMSYIIVCGHTSTSVIDQFDFLLLHRPNETSTTTNMLFMFVFRLCKNQYISDYSDYSKLYVACTHARTFVVILIIVGLSTGCNSLALA